MLYFVIVSILSIWNRLKLGDNIDRLILFSGLVNLSSTVNVPFSVHAIIAHLWYDVDVDNKFSSSFSHNLHLLEIGFILALVYQNSL